MSDTLACSTCISKGQSNRSVPMRCRARPGQGCFQETTNFLTSFKEKLTQSAQKYLQSVPNGGSRQEQQDLEKNFRELQQLDFKL